MKLLSFAVPCFNSEEYLENCLQSLLIGGMSVEIIIVNDGSTDGTQAIAEKFKKNYPQIVKVVEKENGGHGDAVISALHEATGKYFKVVDSDDWLDSSAYQKVLQTLENLSKDKQDIDMFISNYVYEKEGAVHKKVMKYTPFLPQEKLFTWNQAHLPIGKYILMHSVIYRTDLLVKMSMTLPKHTFYVDNLYVFKPLTNVKTMYYLNVNLYRYHIGRDDQSVNEKNMIARIDQQLFVNKEMMTHYVEQEFLNRRTKRYMRSYLQIITTISSILLIMEGTKESIGKKEALWDYLAEADEGLYRRLRYSLPGIIVNLPGKNGRRTSLHVYKVYQKLYGFN